MLDAFPPPAFVSTPCLRAPCPQVHAKIRANPIKAVKARVCPAEKKKWQPRKSTYEERKERLKAKLTTLMAAEDDAEDDE